MLDPSTIVALEMAPRLVAGQFAEPPRPPKRPFRDSPGKPARALAARALRTIADSLEPSPEERTAS